MSRFAYLCLALLVLALAGCNSTVPSTARDLKSVVTQGARTAKPGPSRTPDCGGPPVCKCVSPQFVEAWVDRNGNGSRDPDDVPLHGVRVRLRWIEGEEGTCVTPYVEGYYLSTDATGHDFYPLGGCGCGTEKLEPETPAGYKLTTNTRGECLFSHPDKYGNYSMRNMKCQRYGFTPTAP